MSVQLVLVLLVWLGLALWLYLPHAMVSAGAVSAVLLAKRDELRDRYDRARGRCDEPFEAHEHFYYE